MKVTWISLNDGYPEESQEVLVYTERDVVGVAFFDKKIKKFLTTDHYGDVWWEQGAGDITYFDGVTHWIPLPQYDEDEETVEVVFSQFVKEEIQITDRDVDLMIEALESYHAHNLPNAEKALELHERLGRL